MLKFSIGLRIVAACSLPKEVTTIVFTMACSARQKGRGPHLPIRLWGKGTPKNLSCDWLMWICLVISVVRFNTNLKSTLESHI